MSTQVFALSMLCEGLFFIVIFSIYFQLMFAK